MTTTFWSVMTSSAESRRENPSASADSSSSAKNSKVLALNARANFENISEICGGLDEPSISGIFSSLLLLPFSKKTKKLKNKKK